VTALATVVRWRFDVDGRGPNGVEVLAASEALAWAKLRAAETLADATVRGGPVRVATVAIQGVRLQEVLGAERAA
jgi:hypothetical protein